MKVLMTADTLGGVWTYCMELCAALAPYEIDISLATMGRKLSPEQRWQVNRLPHVEIHESTYRLFWMQNAWQDVEKAGAWLLSLEQELKPDVVHLNDLGHSELNWKTPVVLVGHSCVFSWWEAVHKQAPPAEWRRYRETATRGVRQADQLIAPSQWMLNALIHYYGPAKACGVIYNGRDFPPLAQDFSSWAEPNVSSNYNTVWNTTKKCEAEPLIFAAGRIWDHAKNIAAVAKIANQLSWPVYAAGEQADPNGGTNIPEGINCLGYLNSDEMAQWLRRAAIYVAPAHYEPFGLSILEAARAGCALVLGDIASLREVWGDTAEYVDPDDSGQLKQVLTMLIEEPNRRQYLARQAWQQAQRYTASKMAAEYMRCYRNLVTSVSKQEQIDKPLSGARA